MSHKILVVDDDSTNRRVIIQFLNSFGYTAKAVNSGKECLEELGSSSSEEYSLIIMDLVMEDMDGQETTTAIRNELKNNIPIVLLTAARLNPEDIKKIIECGANTVLEKPIFLNSFRESIKELLQQSEQSEYL